MKEVLEYLLLCGIVFVIVILATAVRLYYYKQDFKLLKWFCLLAIVLIISGGIKLFLLEK